MQFAFFASRERIECPYGGGFGVLFEIRIHGSEPLLSLSVLVVNLAFRQRQLSVKLDVEDNEAVGCQLLDEVVAVFVGQNEAGDSGLYLQDFSPEGGTSATRRPLFGFSERFETESFGISPDGRRIVVSRMVEVRTIRLAENVPGITR